MAASTDAGADIRGGRLEGADTRQAAITIDTSSSATARPRIATTTHILTPSDYSDARSSVWFGKAIIKAVSSTFFGM
ncbi:hypothetical protein GCM10022419_132450 [Nonomuraea rosea]|uniref:Uncharacterized protein n=1 Tax=Nonomuraea rosea TaxID=638574 RepID=A0ABP7A3N8_9ACTN